MPSFSTPALVLRRSDYSDSDRMVTLFAPEHGRIDAIARGCRRPKSPLMNCCEPFVSGEFQLYRRGERVAIEQCQISESCFELRSDYDRLRHGAYWLRLLDACVMPDAPMPALFLITLRALAHLNYSELPPELLTMAFEMHLMKQLGLAPRVDVCLICGRPIDGDARFDASRGGCICLHCAPEPRKAASPTAANPPSPNSTMPRSERAFARRPAEASHLPVPPLNPPSPNCAATLRSVGTSAEPSAVASRSPMPPTNHSLPNCTTLPCEGESFAARSGAAETSRSLAATASEGDALTGHSGAVEDSSSPVSAKGHSSLNCAAMLWDSGTLAHQSNTSGAVGSVRRVPGQGYWNAPRISNGARRILLKLPRTRYDQVKLLDGHPDWPEAARLFRPYVELHVPAQKFAPPLYEPPGTRHP